MAVYQAPNILDRAATGDDLYNIITQSDGRSKLVPSPDEVAEPGTPINRALLQPLMEAVQQSSEDLVPYTDHWWRIRQTAGSYSLKVVPFGQISGAYSTRTSDGAYVVSVVNRIVDSDGSVNSNGARTIQVAASVSVGSDGTISLVNPTSYTISADNISTYASTLNGKYAKGLVQNTDVVYKINTSGISSYQEAMDYGSYTRTTTHHCYTASSLTSTIVQVATAEYSASAGDFQYISNSDENFYPHSGTVSGVEYLYLGKVFEKAIQGYTPELKTVAITSASYSSNSYAVDVPGRVCLIWSGWVPKGYTGAPMGIIFNDTGKVYYFVNDYNSGYYRNFKASETITAVYASTSTYTNNLCKYSGRKLFFGTANGASSNYATTVYLLPIVP